jgi:hypothetical protein
MSIHDVCSDARISPSLRLVRQPFTHSGAMKKIPSHEADLDLDVACQAFLESVQARLRVWTQGLVDSIRGLRADQRSIESARAVIQDGVMTSFHDQKDRTGRFRVVFVNDHMVGLVPMDLVKQAADEIEVPVLRLFHQSARGVATTWIRLALSVDDVAVVDDVMDDTLFWIRRGKHSVDGGLVYPGVRLPEDAAYWKRETHQIEARAYACSFRTRPPIHVTEAVLRRTALEDKRFDNADRASSKGWIGRRPDDTGALGSLAAGQLRLVNRYLVERWRLSLAHDVMELRG